MEVKLGQYKNLLNTFVGFKSVSTDSAFKPEIEKTVNWLKKLFIENGFTAESLQGPSTNPVVLATYTVSLKAETVLIYGHYDVQPANKIDGWEADPFAITEKNGRYIARGIVDNKGQLLIHMFTIFALVKEKKLKYNVKFLIEGNEETANPDIAKLIKENKAKLKSNYVMVSDGELASNRPVIEYSLRGGMNCTLTYITAKNNLHSGLYGGAAPSSTHELAKLIAKFYTKNNKVAIPGFYEGVDKITADQQKSNKKLVKNIKEILGNTGLKTLTMEQDMDFYSQTGLRPTIQVTGIKSGYIDEGYANIVPATAEARINFRFVTSQNPEKAFKAFEKFVKANTPKYVTYTIARTMSWYPIKLDISSKKFAEVREFLKKAFTDEVLIKPVGGSIPVVTDFKDILGIDTLLVSLGNDDCNMHGVNENYNIELIEKGLKFSELFFSK